MKRIILLSFLFAATASAQVPIQQRFGWCRMAAVNANKGEISPDVGSPIAWWTMNETDTNATQILDVAGSLNLSNKPNVATGPRQTTVAGQQGYTFDFTNYFISGDASAISFGNGVTDFPFTITMLIKTNRTPFNYEWLLTKGDTVTGTVFEYLMYFEPSGPLGIMIKDTARNKLRRVEGTGGSTGADWHNLTNNPTFVCLQYDPTQASLTNQITLWWDAKRKPVGIVTDDAGYISMTNTIKTFIIARPWINAFGTTMWIGDVRIFNTLITPTQMTNILTSMRTW